MRLTLGLLLVILCFAVPAYASLDGQGADRDVVPMTLSELQTLQKKEKKNNKGENFLPLDIRRDALVEAAVSYGARGGLAYRTYHIRRELDQQARYLDKVFDFSQLLIPAPSGFLIEPPVVSENINAMIIDNGGMEAAVSDRIFNINRNARITSTARNWRTYLERKSVSVDPPPDVLIPENEEERRIWIEKVNAGWEEGVRQANEVFEADLARLTADFQGMVRYRLLLSQGMISPPYALQVDRGVTGGGNEMRVGDRAVQITGVPALIPEAQEWQPANR